MPIANETGKAHNFSTVQTLMLEICLSNVMSCQPTLRNVQILITIILFEISLLPVKNTI